MGTVTTPVGEQQDPGRAYTKRLRLAIELQFFLWLGAVLAYGYFGLHQSVASFAKVASNNFYVQVTACWIPLWAISTIGSLLVSCYRFYLDHKFQLARSGLHNWLLDSLKANTLAGILGSAIVEIAFASHKLSPSYGWIWAGLLCSLLLFGVTESSPWLLSLFYPVVPLSNNSLHVRLTHLAAKANIRVGAICEWRISARTRQANALVAGMGTSRRILLTDTLISELSEDEVEAIVGHELGHCALHHVSKRVLLRSVTFCGIFWIINTAVRNDLVWLANKNMGWNNLQLLPGFFLLWTFGYIYANIILVALSRQQEKAADLYSWKLIGRVGAFITAMQKLTDLNLIVFDKSSQWKHSHPATPGRIAAAEQFAKAQGEMVVVVPSHNTQNVSSLAPTQDSPK